MASLNLAGKTSGYVKLTAPDDSSNNPTVTLPTESGELALKSDIGEGGDSIWTEVGGNAVYDGGIVVKNNASIGNTLVMTSETTGAQHIINAASSVGNMNLSVDENKATTNPKYIINVQGNAIATFSKAGEANKILDHTEVTADGVNGLDLKQDNSTSARLFFTNNKESWTAMTNCNEDGNTFFEIRRRADIGSQSGDEYLQVNHIGRLVLPKYETLGKNGSIANMFMSDDGTIYKANVTSYSAEEVDEKLAVKDKLIEKLSERLDKLEKKLKK